MKLSRLYSNRPEVFAPIQFLPGLNVVLAEIRLPENRAKDTHNLGKTTLGRLIDFCLLLGRNPSFFLFKHLDRFESFVFFLELELLDGSFVTLRRSVAAPSEISFKRHHQAQKDFNDLPEGSWDHVAVPFERAKDLLDGILDFRDIAPWHYRKVVGYLLRSQEDFREVFHLGKFVGRHADWKPFLAHILGFDGSLMLGHYEKEDELKRKELEEGVIKSELGGTIADSSKIEGLLLLKQKEAEKKQRLLDQFDFRQADREKTRTLVDDLDESIRRLNNDRYALTQSRKKITTALGDGEFLFDADQAGKLFAEAGVVFGGQLRKDFEQLLAFNRAITEERRGYLEEEILSIEADVKRLNTELNDLGKHRSETLSFLTGTDVFGKYKAVSDELVTLKASITNLERQREFLHRLQELRAEIRGLSEQKDHLQAAIEADVERQNAEKSSMFSSIRVLFSEIVDDVINRKALLSVAPNAEGHVEFKAEILDESGSATSADLGFTYRKLLCIAFDLALLRAHLNGRYPRFVVHDGAFESLDDRKKENLLAVIREHASLGIQQVITLIDSDVPSRTEGSGPVFAPGEVVVRLHDLSESGRLFKMPAW